MITVVSRYVPGNAYRSPSTVLSVRVDKQMLTRFSLTSTMYKYSYPVVVMVPVDLRTSTASFADSEYLLPVLHVSTWKLEKHVERQTTMPDEGPPVR